MFSHYNDNISFEDPHNVLQFICHTTFKTVIGYKDMSETLCCSHSKYYSDILSHKLKLERNDIMLYFERSIPGLPAEYHTGNLPLIKVQNMDLPLRDIGLPNAI